MAGKTRLSLRRIAQCAAQASSGISHAATLFGPDRIGKRDAVIVVDGRRCRRRADGPEMPAGAALGMRTEDQPLLIAKA
jgi:hypothetical protein